MNDHPLSRMFHTVCDRHLLIYSVHKKNNNNSQVNTKKSKTVSETNCQENRYFLDSSDSASQKELDSTTVWLKVKGKKKTFSQSERVDHFECFSDTDESAGITEGHSTSCSLFQNPRPCCWCRPSFVRQSLA